MSYNGTMFRFVQYLIDFLFPPSKEELLLRALSPVEFFGKVEKVGGNTLFSYKDPLVKELVWQIKYKKNRHAIRCAAYAIYTELNKETKPVVLIPIPISKKRRKERGYNQCELIINEVLKIDTKNKISKNFNILIRTKHIEKQTFKNRNERIKNIKDIFQVLDDNLSFDSRIILVDDVITTGSTLREARNVLINKGYTDVRIMALAH